MHTILVPLDGSSFAERILPYVQLLARVLEAKVQLIRVVSSAEHGEILTQLASIEVGASLSASPVCAACSMADLCQGAQCALAKQAVGLRASGVDAAADTRVGTAAAVIAAMSEQSPGTLIAMATHGRGGLRRWVLGSTADSLLQSTSASLLLMPGEQAAPPADWAIKRILIPLDGSEFARQALPLAIELAARGGAELIVLQVAARSIEEYLQAVPAATDARQLLYDQIELAFGALASEMRQQPVHVSITIAVGPVAQAIVDDAAQYHADLIVMATHGYTGIKRWKLGSVADKVLHATTTPVLLVRASSGEQ